MITLSNVTLTYPDGASRIIAVDNVSLAVARGSVVGLSGPSGSGKSSLLAVISTLIRPDSGSVRIDDVEVTGLSLSERAELRRDHLGIVFQQSNLLPALTALEQLLVMEKLGARTPRGGASKAETRRHSRSRAMDLLAAVGVERQAHKFPAMLSGGERQRVNIARALMNDPTVLVVDEPTSSLDQARGTSILNLITRLTIEQNTATVLVTHDEQQLQRFETYYVMVDGVATRQTLAADAQQTPPPALLTTGISGIPIRIP
ncbi:MULTISPECIES: ABC transporter ATP-binding protein [Subtercola]|uniref:ATP-binding cassette domain-containing protein n=1 Tax=Subtercola vilae TaxID=2056433 RepID=A0A4T2C647_9MICO|nr:MULTISPECIES: ATP-binding cassette domain-containing protein [Subtercola]MEA9984872.1 ATP-binding cassette domain-containing protein [Subtercola sp. RTI3]TIH39895.1 ATP-binding cassette domain-containing protein [Subtercola vilae]